MMYRKKCGTLVGDRDRFCENCGDLVWEDGNLENDEEESLIRWYFSQSYINDHILKMLHLKHGYHYKIRTLKRRSKTYGLKRAQNVSDQELNNRWKEMSRALLQGWVIEVCKACCDQNMVLGAQVSYVLSIAGAKHFYLF